MIADRAVQLLQATPGLMPEPDDLRGQLVLLRTHVRRRDLRAAEALLDTLIVQAASNGHAPTLRLPPLRKAPSKACPFGWKYSAKGKRQRNRKHVCGPECSWSSAEALAWLRETPYKIAPGVEIMSRLVPIPPCANCDRKRSDHWEPAADSVTGRLTGYRAIKECTYEPAGEA